MATRKPTNDPVARDNAAEFAIQTITRGGDVIDDDVSAAKAVVDGFTYVEYEYAPGKVAGETKTFRRLVLTGDWEITTEKVGFDA